LHRLAQRNEILKNTLEKIELIGILTMFTMEMGGGAHGIPVQESDF
jgi:hypothetical protein